MTAIEWTDATWNPVTGCDRVSPGCAHCYALDLAARLKGMGQVRYQKDGDPKTSGPGFGVTLHPDRLDEPLRWRKPRRVFVNSMSDLFHEEIPDEYIGRVLAVMARARNHTFQVLTKRPERMQALLGTWLSGMWGKGEFPHEMLRGYKEQGGPRFILDFPLPNVWWGVSIENRRFVHRADLLRETPAAVRFVSAEPLLGPLLYDAGDMGLEEWPEYTSWSDANGVVNVPPELDLYGIDWLIAGGESGAGHRPIEADWVRDLREAASDAGTAFFFKQWGGRTPKAGGRVLDGRTWDEYPAPKVAA